MFDLLMFFWLAAKASLFSSNGVTNLPTLRADLLARDWATDRAFSEALAVGQIAPGPSGLWIVSLGYLIAGVPGALAAVAATLLPPALVLPIERLYQRHGRHPLMLGFTHGMGLAVVGVGWVVMAQLLSASGLEPGTIGIALGAAALVLSGRAPIIGVIALAAVIGGVIFNQSGG